MTLRLAPILVLALALAACGGPKAEKPAAVAAENAPDPFTPPTPQEAVAHAEAQAKTLSACGPVSADGFCRVTFGMTVDEVRKAWPGKLENLAGDDPQTDPNGCYEIFGNEPIEGVSFLVEHGKVGRVDFLNEGPKTADGFGVGSAGVAIQEKYGAALNEQPDKYEPEVTLMSLEQGAAKFVFEVESGKVRAWRAGLAPSVDYAEKCG